MVHRTILRSEAVVDFHRASAHPPLLTWGAKDVYELLADFANKANLPDEIAKLKASLEQLDEEHAQQLGD